ncbi:MAG TPA: hypothetical protein VF170_10355 [Planctomycetaceae bacterium]
MLKTLFRRPAARPVRNRLAPRIAAETLEDRIVLSAVAATSPIATITDVTVNDVAVVDNQLVANATVTGNVLGTDFTRDVQIPLQLGATDGGEGACDVLNLSLGPLNLDVLGLQVDLDDCAGGPVTVDITGVEGEGNLLGNLICDIAGLLDDGGLLDLGGLTDTELDTLTSGLTEILNGVFDKLFASGSGGDTAAAAAQDSGGSTDILNLELGATTLDLLGLVVETSDICLNVTADQGSGNLLGNLLGSIARLLDKDPGNAVDALIRRAERLLDSLDLDEVTDELLTGRRRR